MGFQEQSGMKVSTQLQCMESKLDIDFVNARLSYAKAYAENGAYYEPTQQLTTLGREIQKAAAACPSFSELLWDEIQTISKGVIKVADFTCKYKDAVMFGIDFVLSLVGAPEFAPEVDEAIEEGCDVLKIGESTYDVAKNALNTIQDGRTCAQVTYDTYQYAENTSNLLGKN